MTTHGFAQAPFAEGRLGDLSATLQFPTSKALLITYTIRPEGGAGLLINYTVEPFGAAAIPIVYWVTPAIQDFSINGTVLLARPTNHYYTFPAQVGYDQMGVPEKQGWTTVVWEYDVMLDTTIAQLMSFYNPQSPEVVITYPNELGFWTQKQAMMQPPDLGTRQTIEHDSVKFTFTHISSD